MGRRLALAARPAHFCGTPSHFRNGEILTLQSMRITTFTERPPKLPGTRPAGTFNEREASARVRDMFSRIAPRYDFLNHFLSFSLDRYWRLRAARKFHRILRRTDARVLDLCCGTGDLTFALERVRIRELRDSGAYRFPLIGSDFAQPMLNRARLETRRAGGNFGVFRTGRGAHGGTISFLLPANPSAHRRGHLR